MSAFPPEYVRAHLLALGCDPARVEESFIHSGGHGGQNVNKVATCVQLRYAPRHILLKMQEHRTQAANRLAAWKLLAAQLQRQRDQQAAERQAARELKRRQNAPRPRGIKKQFVELKRRQNAPRPRGIKKQFVELKRRRAKTREGRRDVGRDEG